MMKVNRSLQYLLLGLVFWLSLAQGRAQSSAATKTKQPKALVEFSLPSGFYEENIVLSLSCPGAVIHYTLDGSLPDRRAPRYTKPIEISETTVVQAIAYQKGYRTKVLGHTYFIEEPTSQFPTISLGITPSVLFDPETGLYVQGPNAVDSLWRKDGANFWSRREIRIHTELFEADQKREFASVTGFRLFGGMSRLFPQKSMTLVARDRYGKKHFKHRIFGSKGMKKYKYLVLRNSGSDWGKSHFRDAFMTGLLKDWDLEVQQYRPAHVYLNGDYWGLYNIREKINRTYLADHFDLEKDSIDLIEHKSTLKRGSRRHYLRLLRYLRQNSMAEPGHYAYIQSQMEVDNFMDYQIAQIYFDNRDAGGNIKFWRPQIPTGRWRWILYDTDWGFGLHDPRAYAYNSLAFHTEPEGPSWPNPPWSTFILRKLLKSPTFQQRFINRFADHLNTAFESDHVQAEIDRYVQLLNPEIPRHFQRWRLKDSRWEQHIAIMKKFALRRPNYMRQHLQEKFYTGGTAEVQISSSEGGYLFLNDHLKISGETFSGTYFENIPIHLQAIPHYGYRFVRWEGIDMEQEAFNLSLYLDAERPLHLQAVFEPYIHPLAGKVIFNEVSPNHKLAGDWVELYNNSEELVDLSGWVFTDSKHEYVLPPVMLPAEGYLILCQDSAAFRQEYPLLDAHRVVGDFHFGLSKRKERLSLYTNEGASIDSVAYEVEPMDTTFTLSLLLPQLNNQDPENWEVNVGPGTPKAINPYYLESRIRAEQELWVRTGVAVGLLLCGLLVLYMRHNYQRRQLANKAASIPLEISNPPETDHLDAP